MPTASQMESCLQDIFGCWTVLSNKNRLFEKVTMDILNTSVKKTLVTVVLVTTTACEAIWNMLIMVRA